MKTTIIIVQAFIIIFLVINLDKPNSFIFRLMAPGYSYCEKCKMPWKFVERHITQFTEIVGCFSLCEECWQKLKTPEKRMPYYKALWEKWNSDIEEWKLIEKAVNEEC